MGWSGFREGESLASEALDLGGGEGDHSNKAPVLPIHWGFKARGVQKPIAAGWKKEGKTGSRLQTDVGTVRPPETSQAPTQTTDAPRAAKPLGHRDHNW